MNVKHLLLCASLGLIAACSGTNEDEVSELECDDGHGCPDGYSCIDHQCIADDASIANDQVQASGEALGAPAVVEVETGTCKGPTCEIAAGSDVTFRAPALVGYRFTGWSGDSRCQGNDPVLMLTNVAANIRCVANYVKRVVISGQSALSGASVGALSEAGFASCSASSCEVDQGSSVVLTAGAVADHLFTGFSGEGCTPATGNVTTVVAADADITCTANYVAVFSVSGLVEGAIGNVVATSDEGVAQCSANHCSVPTGASVTLNAPALPSFRFSGWSGDAEGCAGGALQITLSGITKPIVCVAHYVPRYRVSSGTLGLPESGELLASSADAFATCANGACEVDQDSTVQLVAPTVAGYRFLGFEGDGCEDPADLTTTTLTLDGVASDLECLARYEALPPNLKTVTGLMQPGVPGAVSALPSPPCEDGICIVDVASNTAVTLTAPTVPNWRFTGWSGAGCSGGNPLTLQNVQTDYTCTAHYAQRFTVEVAVAGGGGGTVGLTPTQPAACNGLSCTVDKGSAVTITATKGSGYRFDRWTGDSACNNLTTATLSFDVASNTRCTANFVQQVTVNFSAVANGTVTVPTPPASGTCGANSCTIDSGTAVTLQANPSNTTYVFASWDCSSSQSPSLTLTPTALVTTCRATFARVQYDVQYSATNGGTVTGPCNASPATSGSCLRDHGSQPQIVASQTNGTRRFSGWTAGPGGTCTGTSSGTNGTTLTLAALTGPVDCIANYVPRVQVSFGSAGNGSVAASNLPPFSNCGAGSCTIDQDASLTLTATPVNGNYEFASWNCSPSISATLTRAYAVSTTCTASFALRQYTVNYEATNGGSVTGPCGANPAAGSCLRNHGTQHTLTASHSNPNHRFTGWTAGTGGTCNGTTSGPGGQTMALGALNGPVNCIANYLRQYVVAGTYAGSPASTVTATSGSPNASCSPSPGSSVNCKVDPNGSVTLTGANVTDHDITSWTGATCVGGVMSGNAISFSNVNADITCTPVYTAKVTVTIAKTPAGIPNTIRISGLNCAANGTSCKVKYGTQVTLSAGSHVAGTFLRWSGPQCSGSSANHSFTATQNQTCTAEFSGYWAMLYRLPSSINAGFNAILPLRDRLFAFGTHLFSARSASIVPGSGVPTGSERLHSVSTDFYTGWHDAISIEDDYAVLGDTADGQGNAQETYLLGGGAHSWLRKVETKLRSNLSKICELQLDEKTRGVVLTGTLSGGMTARVMIGNIAQLYSADENVPAVADARISRVECDRRDPMPTRARGITRIKSGDLVIINESTAEPKAGGQPEIWLVRTNDALRTQGNVSLVFGDDEIQPTALMLSEVVPTPAAGGFLIVGAISLGTSGRWDGFAAKIDDELQATWSYFFNQPAGNDILHGAIVNDDGEYVLVGETQQAGYGYDGWLVVLDRDGGLRLNLAMGTPDPKGQSDEVFLDVRQASSGGYFVGGSNMSSPDAAWALHMPKDGNVPFNDENAHIVDLGVTMLLNARLVPSNGGCLAEQPGDASFVPTTTLTSSSSNATTARQAW